MRRALLAVLAITVGACGTGDRAAGDGKPVRKLQEQTFSPPYPAAQPGGRLNWIGRARLDDARLVLTVEFTGSKGYLESDLCSEDYTAWVGGTNARLEVAIVQVEHFRPNLGVACTLEGYGYTFHLGLPQRYEGVEVLDRGGGEGRGGTLFVGPPGDVANLAHVPDGWKLVRSEQEYAGEPATWTQVYAAADVAEQPFEGQGRLVLYQAFGIAGEWSDLRAVKSEGRGGHAERVTFRGAPADVWVDPDSGELLLAWDLAGRSYGLIGNAADMTALELVEYAESLTVVGH